MWTVPQTLTRKEEMFEVETAQLVLGQKAHQEAPGSPQSQSDDIEKITNAAPLAAP